MHAKPTRNRHGPGNCRFLASSRRGGNAHDRPTMPSQKQLNRDGNEVNGQPIYSQSIEFANRATAGRFGAMILDVVRAAHADDLAGSP